MICLLDLANSNIRDQSYVYTGEKMISFVWQIGQIGSWILLNFSEHAEQNE